MADNLNEMLKRLVSEMDKNALNAAIPRLKNALSTPEGRELMRKIKASDKETLTKLIGEIKPNAKRGFEGIADNPESIKRLIERLYGRE